MVEVNATLLAQLYHVIVTFLLIYLFYRMCRSFIRNRDAQRQREEEILRKLDELLEMNKEHLKHLKAEYQDGVWQ